MGNTNFRGPVNSMGSLEIQSGNTATIEPQDGPSLIYQGVGIPDPRFAFQKDQVGGGLQPAWVSGQGSLLTVDQIPQALASNWLATSQAIATAAFPATLQTTQVGIATASAAAIAVGVPIIPVGTTVATTVIALDFGFATGTTAAASTTVVVVDNRLFRLGQWIIIGGAGNSAAQLSHICQVVNIHSSSITSISISPAAVTTIVNAPIGQGNLFGSTLLPVGSQLGPATASANAHSFGGAFPAGIALAYNPRECLTRTISLTSVTSQDFSAVVQGWDLYGNPMSEILAMTNQTTMQGKKAFKYIGSITSGTAVASGTQAVAFGLSDTIGFPLRADTFSEVTTKWNNVQQVNTNGIAFAVTSPATGTTGDVRGTLALSTAILTGGLATAASLIATNGTGRVSIVQVFTPVELVFTNPTNTAPMFGVPQNTATT